MNIVYFNDLVKYLMAARQNVLVISSATLFEKENLQLKVINGDIKLVESDLTMHENLLHLLLKKHWTPCDIKSIVGYCVLIDLLTSINANDISQNPAYSVIKDISDGAWRSAFTSNEEIDKYKAQVARYNKLTDKERILISLGEINGMRAPVDPLSNKSLSIYGMEQLFIDKSVFAFSREIPVGGDVISLNGEKALVTHFDFKYYFDVRIPEHVVVDEMRDEYSLIDDFHYRVQHVPTKDGSISTFRCQSTKPISPAMTC